MEQGQPVCALESSEISVRRASSANEYREATSLVQEMYSRRGYLTDSVGDMTRDEDTVTIDAYGAHQVMGTLTVRMDSPQGLLADQLYAEEINEFRAAGSQVCEMSKLAVDPQFGSKELMASLIQLAYLYAHVVYGSSRLVIEVNPRHAGFYKRMLGFREAGERRTCPRVNAPAVLLQIELEYMRSQIAQHGGRGYCAGERTLYPYFLNCGAEEWIDRARGGVVGSVH
ncbi:MAG: N-acetyltransferase [Burkholderiales bacterium]